MMQPFKVSALHLPACFHARMHACKHAAGARSAQWRLPWVHSAYITLSWMRQHDRPRRAWPLHGPFLRAMWPRSHADTSLKHRKPLGGRVLNILA